jgi:gliding motility-associated protein GldM
MSIPKENRQQMINLMYLVLTALLALNVSAEILNAFRTINNSLEGSNKLLDVNSKVSYNAFVAKKLKEPANLDVIKYQEKADKVLELSKNLQDYIKTAQEGIIKEAGGAGEEGTLMKRQDDLDASTRFFIEGKKEGYTLKKKIEDFKAELSKLLSPEQFKEIEGKLPLNTTPQKANGDWARDNFYQMPPIASYTILTKVTSDVKATEGQMVQYLYQQIGSMKDLEPEEIVLDQFSAQVASPSAYVLQGETFEANVFLAASSSESSVKVSVNGTSLPVKDGVGTFKTSGSGIGEHPLNGVVTVVNNRTGKTTTYKTPEFKYTVAAPFATVSPTKMNVFYIGVPNPVQVSAAGVANSKLNVSMSNGTITGSGGKYEVRVTTQGTTNVTVSANGKNYGAFPFRVKLIPNPIAKVSGLPGGRINAGVWKAQQGVVADLENFDFDAKFEVLSFNMFYQPKLQDPGIASATGPYFSAAQKAFIAKAKPGDIFYIEEIKVKGPDGLSRKIPGVAFKID